MAHEVDREKTPDGKDIEFRNGEPVRTQDDDDGDAEHAEE